MLNKKILMAAVTFGALVFTGAAAQAYTTYQYTYYDKDGNGFIESNEFDAYVYKAFDMDQDNLIESDEWTYYATVTTDPTIDYQTFDVWDVNSDSYLSQDELNTFVRETDYYSLYDLDDSDTIDSNEYSRAVFNRYDMNMDGAITDEEWMNVYNK